MWIQIVLPHAPKKGQHLRLDALSVRQDIASLLLEDARDAIKEVSLQTQGKGRLRAREGFACLGDIDLIDGFLCDLALRGLAGGGNHPAAGSEAFVSEGHAMDKERTYQMVATPYCVLARTVQSSV